MPPQYDANSFFKSFHFLTVLSKRKIKPSGIQDGLSSQPFSRRVMTEYNHSGNIRDWRRRQRVGVEGGRKNQK